MVTTSTIDYVTAAVVLAVAAAVACASSAVLHYYARALRTAPRKNGLLLYHIVAISSSVTGTWLLLGLGQLDLLGLVQTPRSIRLIGYAFFGLLTIVAIGLIAVEQRRRVQSGPSETVVINTQTTVYDEKQAANGDPGPET